MRPIPDWMDGPNCVWYDHAEGLIDDLRHIHRNFSLSNIELVSLDNDLGEGCMEGYQVLDWLESLHEKIPFGIHIHTANPVAIERMRAIIQRNGWTEVR